MLIKDARWQDSADIVVVGYGGAGAVAAITAHDLGAEVLLVEKQLQDSHYTSTQMSGGNFIFPTEVETAFGYMESLYRVENGLSWTDRDTLRAWAEYSHQNKSWIEGMGGVVKPWGISGSHPQIPGRESIARCRFPGLHHLLTSRVAQRGIRVLFHAPAQKLITDLHGRVVGVRVAAREGRRPMDIKAHRAVIMTLGGFEFNETMKLNYLRVYPTYFTGTPACTGDGHRMVMEVGADLWHMNACVGGLVAKFPEFPMAFHMDFGGKLWTMRRERPQGLKPGEQPAAHIFVDGSGRRFAAESHMGHILYHVLTLYDSQALRYPRVPSFWIFDQERMAAGPLASRIAGASGPVQLYPWSKDNSVELEKGWIIRGETIVELAEKLGVPGDNLAETVRSYNSFCCQGHDPQFNRRPSELAPLCNPPFYAVRLYPGGPNTQGGPRRNHRAQVLNVDGDPIPRLYAAGEFGSVYGMLYPGGGGNLAECIAFGRIAAENGVREEPLSQRSTSGLE